MTHRQQNCGATIKMIQRDIAAAAEVDRPFPKFNLHTAIKNTLTQEGVRQVLSELSRRAVVDFRQLGECGGLRALRAFQLRHGSLGYTQLCGNIRLG